jgi:hypothetical protein
MQDKNPHPDDLTTQIENFEFAFADALKANGFGDGHNIKIKANGKWGDILLPGETNKSGGVKLTFGGDGVVIDRRQSDKVIFTWTPDHEVKLSPEQWEEIARHNAERAAKTKQRQEAVRREWAERFPKLPDMIPDHPYLKRKQITNVIPLKIEGTSLAKAKANKGLETWIVVPLFNAVTGEFQAVHVSISLVTNGFPRTA